MEAECKVVEATTTDSRYSSARSLRAVEAPVHGRVLRGEEMEDDCLDVVDRVESDFIVRSLDVSMKDWEVASEGGCDDDGDDIDGEKSRDSTGTVSSMSRRGSGGDFFGGFADL